MSALSRCLQSASQQFVSVAQPSILNDRAKAVLAATLLVLTAAALAPGNAQAQTYVWGNGGNNNGDQSVLPQSSVSRFGSMVGSALGRAVGIVATDGMGNNQVGRALQSAVQRTTEEVGNNLGKAAASLPYADAQKAGVAHVTPQGSQLGQYPQARTVPSADSIPQSTRDHIDTLGMKAIFAYGDAMAAVPGTDQFRFADNARKAALRDFEMAVRTAQSRGFILESWADARLALQQPLGRVSADQMQRFATIMSDRLHRAGGPGYVTAENRQSVEVMQSNMRAKYNQVLASDAPRN